MKLHLIVWGLSILSTGLMAGLFFTWSNAVMPGIGRVDDTSFLSALKAMNKVILNPAFFLIFFGSVATTLITPVLTYNHVSKKVLIVMVAGGLIYFLGMFLVTIFGNIPLNRMLEGSVLDQLSPEQLSELRQKIENPWKRLNWVRTISSFAAFVLILLSGYMHFSSD